MRGQDFEAILVFGGTYALIGKPWSYSIKNNSLVHKLVHQNQFIGSSELGEIFTLVCHWCPIWGEERIAHVSPE